MASKSRPSVTSFLSTSSRALQTQQELEEAQNRIIQLEKELASEREQLLSEVDDQRISHATVPIHKILRRPYQSRRQKDPQAFSELVHSIGTYGFRGSIWVQRLPDGQLRLVAGETRLDAAISAGLTEISVDIAEIDDITAVKLSRVENSRRRNLNALDDTEELLYLLMLTLEKNNAETKKILYRYKNAAEGKSSIDLEVKTKIESVFEEVAPELGILSFISSRLPLLELPSDVLDAYNTGNLDYTKAIHLGRIEAQGLRQELLQEVVENRLSLSALKKRIQPNSGRTVIDKVGKLQEQVQGITPKLITKLSVEQRTQLKRSILELEALLKQKVQELESAVEE